MGRGPVIFLLFAVGFAACTTGATPSVQELRPRGPQCSGTIVTASGVGSVDVLPDQSSLRFSFMVNSAEISEAMASARKFLDALAKNLSVAVPDAPFDELAIKHISYGVSGNNPESTAAFETAAFDSGATTEATAEGVDSEEQTEYGEVTDLSSPLQDDTVAFNVSLKLAPSSAPSSALFIDEVPNKSNFIRMHAQTTLPKDLSEEATVKVVDATMKALQELKDSSAGAMSFGSDDMQFYPGSQHLQLQWSMSDGVYAEPRKAARKQALQEAMSKAQEFAELLDVQLDKNGTAPLSIAEGMDGFYIDMNNNDEYSFFDTMESISIRPSTRKVTAAITLVYCFPPSSSATVGS